MIITYLAFIDDDANKDLFVVLYERHRRFLLDYAKSVLGKKFSGDAEDVVQEAFIAVAKNMEIVKSIPCSKQLAFCVTVVRNKSIDVMRKKKHLSDLSYEDIDYNQAADEPAPLERLINDEGYRMLKDCIRTLDSKYREAVEYRLLYGLSDNDIASLMGISAKLANVRVFRGRQKLKEMLLGKEEHND